MNWAYLKGMHPLYLYYHREDDSLALFDRFCDGNFFSKHSYSFEEMDRLHREALTELGTDGLPPEIRHKVRQ